MKPDGSICCKVTYKFILIGYYYKIYSSTINFVVFSKRLKLFINLLYDSAALNIFIKIMLCLQLKKDSI